jgi:hypothetical protein
MSKISNEQPPLKTSVRPLVAAVCALLITTGSRTLAADDHHTGAHAIDQRSYRLGGIDSFAEVVGMGIKKLALSSAMAPQEMDALVDDARRIAADNSVELYRETDFLVTDLFPASATRGKHVLLIYRGTAKDEYLALKQRKTELTATAKYTGKAREDIAREMGRLLSYPEAKIDEMLKTRR